MTNEEAAKIAKLINEQNQLVVNYEPTRVLASAGNYIVRTDKTGSIIACLELKKVQWYQFEISHVTVAPGQKRKGLARDLVKEAERRAVAQGARILQCTIRDDNVPSMGLFEKCGFVEVSKFYYPASGNYVTVWQKVVSNAPSTAYV